MSVDFTKVIKQIELDSGFFFITIDGDVIYLTKFQVAELIAKTMEAA